MSIVEKAAKRLKNKSANKTHKRVSPRQQDSLNDKTEILYSSEENQPEVDIMLSSDESSNNFSNEQDDVKDDTEYSEEDITDISGYEGFSVKTKKSNFSNNVHLNLNKLNADGFITPKHPDTILSSMFRMIKRPLLENAAGKGASVVKHPNLIMFTSSFTNEGKTYSAINIAISIAMEKDLSVLLIDADIRKPSLAKTFDIEVEEGLTDLLSGKVKDMKDVLYSTNIPSLTIMSAGKPYPNGTELLASDSMSKFIDEISNRYSNRIIIFDSPPLLQTTEASVLATHMGQVVLVVEAEKTLAHEVSKSVDILHNEIVLLLLNKQREKKNDINYGYGYGY